MEHRYSLPVADIGVTQNHPAVFEFQIPVDGGDTVFLKMNVFSMHKLYAAVHNAVNPGVECKIMT